MTAFDWKDLVPMSLDKTQVSELWLLGLEDLGGARYLRIEARGSWRLTMGPLDPCGPDGVVGFPATDKLISGDCAFGALVGRFGGGSAGYSASAADKPFPLGKFSVIKVPDNAPGPLFIAFNSVVRPVEVVEKLSLTIKGSPTTP